MPPHDEHPEGVKIGVLWEERDRHFNHHRQVMEKLDLIANKLSLLPCDKHEGARMLLAQEIAGLKIERRNDLIMSRWFMIGSAVGGGMVVTGTLDIIKLITKVLSGG